MSRLSRAADRIATGSSILTRRLFAGAAAWCARGRREDLTGWKAVLGILVRALVLGLGAYLAARIVRALPWLLWLLGALWLGAAWRASRKRPPPPAEEYPAGVPSGGDGEALRTLLLDLMGTGSAVHLRTVLQHLQRDPETASLTASWTIADLRSRLEAQNIPVHPKVKACGGGPTRGVRREDLAPSPAAPQGTSTTPSTAV
ncbi:hypothetical protein [Streptomyces sp. Je 1-369]|uniref:hypothetical protein n=1 Tax=Streptomyces sp. Je 1-369 TaxID=2966192 RepID=UPI002286984D|nr:hypothetical protein [Streptomyces sp. Je 1-369]WAL93977.1 hypothetical protein NOO62_05360 [Streptomyces sp. Je 1-369]